MSLTVHQESRSCRRCGADPFASNGHCTRRIRQDRTASEEAELHLCGPCCRDLGSDEQKDEYLRLGLLA
jgi:hypothetical protein